MTTQCPVCGLMETDQNAQSLDWLLHLAFCVALDAFAEDPPPPPAPEKAPPVSPCESPRRTSPGWDR